MAKYIVFDASHISRIRYGKARPSNPTEFSNKICTYIFNRYKSPDDINNLSAIIGCKKSDLANNKFYNTLFAWLTSEATPVKSQVSDFLYNLDSFNLDDYIKVIKFDKLKVPSIPFYKAKSRHYYGLEEMKEGELNFFKATELSKSNHFCNPFSLFSFIFTSFFNFSPCDVTIKSLIPKSNPTIDFGFKMY